MRSPKQPINSFEIAGLKRVDAFEKAFTQTEELRTGKITSDCTGRARTLKFFNKLDVAALVDWIWAQARDYVTMLFIKCDRWGERSIRHNQDLASFLLARPIFASLHEQV